MNTYPSFLVALGSADVDIEAVTWALVAVDGTYAAANEFLDDVSTVGAEDTIPGVALTPTATGVTVDTTAIDEASAVTLTGVGTDPVTAFVLFLDTGTPSTSRLVAWIDRKAGNVAVAFTGDGNDVLVWWPGGSFMGGNG